MGVAITLAIAPGAAAAPAPPLSHEGRWITDASGRVVILHGWNMVYKRPPYHPAAAGFGRDDARFLARHGFNTIRLGIIYRGLEPRPGRIDEDYLAQIARTVRQLSREGIFVLLDFHQDLYHERFQGEGFPTWAIHESCLAIPPEPRLGFPGNYVGMPALQCAFDRLWENARAQDGRRIQAAFGAAWRRVAARFRGQPHVFGYNLLNEPWPGSQWPTCANSEGCPAFDRNFLTPFSERVIAAIRRADRRTLVWYAPNVMFDFGARTWHGDTGDPRAGFAFNMYCLAEPGGAGGGLPGVDRGCDATYELTLDNAERHSARTGDALLMTEFAATDDLPTVRTLVEVADRRRMSWQQWHYCDCDDPTTTAEPVSSQALVIDPSKPPRGANVKRGKLRVSARPYPQAVAGTPRAYGFDHQTKRFDLRYSTARAGGGRRFGAGSRTEVFVPRLHYPNGYRVEVDGARVASRPGARRLVLETCPGLRAVSARVTRGAGQSSRCPRDPSRPTRPRFTG
jgi:endoglycosylceramidase